jgi:hypothetical protein
MTPFKSILALCGIILALTACSSNEIGNSQDVAPETVYQQYRIRYHESDAKVELHAQFRFGGRNGTTLVLNSPSGISLDGQPIQVDSSDFGGAFYEVARPASQFGGAHQFVFTDINGKKYENGFNFLPARLASVPTTASRQQPLALVFDGSSLQPGDRIEVSSSATDSSFSISHEVAANQYQVVIPAAQLARQKGEKLILDIHMERNIPLPQLTKEGGEMEYRQQLKTVKLRLEQ